MARRPYAPVLDGTRRIRLRRFDPDDTAGLDKKRAAAKLEKLGEEFAELSNLLAYAKQQALLVVVQGRDASGKDGVIRKVLQFANVLNATVCPFRAPTDEERAHDFLWRVHKVVPRKGQLALFNRSHYEDVLAARVHRLFPADVLKTRYEHINAFERLLAGSGTIVLKFYLHVSRKEQHQRLLEREEDPRTAWKLNVNDWRELALWDDGTAAYEDALNRCASPALPWYLVPADRKWFRNLAVMERLVLALRPYRAGWLAHLKTVRRSALKEIRQLRRKVALDPPVTGR